MTPPLLAAASLGAAAVVVLALSGLHVRRSLRTGRSVDIWHPVLFPSLFVGFSFLAPAFSVFVVGQPVGGAMSHGTPMAASTPHLVALGAVAFALTAWAVARGTRAAVAAPTPGTVQQKALVVRWGARLLVAGSIALALLVILGGGMSTRGLAQTTWDLGDVPEALLSVVPVAALVLLLASTWLAGERRLLALADWVLVGVLLVVVVLTGNRSPLVESLLPLAMFWTWRRGVDLRRLGLGLVAMLVLFTVMVRVRSAALGGSDTRGVLSLLLGDLSPVTFTIGVVAEHVPSVHPYEWGATVLAAVAALLPSILRVPLFGQPEGLGGQVFRRIAQNDNPDYGTALSLPAEGYLNAGVVGLVLSGVLLGLLVGVCYRRLRLDGTTLGLLYPVVVASLPFTIRNDLHGALKGILYPLVLLFVVHLVARVLAVRRRHRQT